MPACEKRAKRNPCVSFGKRLRFGECHCGVTVLRFCKPVFCNLVINAFFVYIGIRQLISKAAGVRKRFNEYAVCVKNKKEIGICILKIFYHAHVFNYKGKTENQQLFKENCSVQFCAVGAIASECGFFNKRGVLRHGLKFSGQLPPRINAEFFKNRSKMPLHRNN